MRRSLLHPVAALALLSLLSPPASAQARPRPPREERQRYSIEQAVSEAAQLHTIAFSALAFLTGDLGAGTFLPPGKVCDLFGFQYLRDIDAAGAGHNPKFLDRVAANVLRTLSESQRRELEALARRQAPEYERLGRMRLPLIEAFYRDLRGEVPEGSPGLDRERVVGHLGELFELDGELSFLYATAFVEVGRSLTDEQRAACLELRGKDALESAPAYLFSQPLSAVPELDSDRFFLERGRAGKAAKPARSEKAARGEEPRSGVRPSFVVVLAEGNGWSGTSVAMDDRLPEARAPAGLTPSLERLASEGLRFSSFYAACPRCTPSRASLLTGVSPAKLRMTYVNESGREKRGGDQGSSGERALVSPEPRTELPADVATIGELLHRAGYATAHFGKWHVGRVDPARRGFDESDGPNTNAGPGGNRSPNPEEATAITEKGLAFVERARDAGRPFYLQLSHYGGGSAEEVAPGTLERLAGGGGRSRGKELYLRGVAADVDASLGRMLAGLDELGLAGNTYVVFTTDHGTPGRRGNEPLSGGKGSVLEGGVRVPFVVRGPGIAPGTTTAVRASSWDLVPTLLELAGAVELVPAEVEGGSLAGVWHGDARARVSRPREELVVHYPHYDLDNGGPASALWLGDRKLVRWYETGELQLFDPIADPGERSDLASKEPDRVRELDARLSAYLEAVEAQLPTPRGASSSGGEGASSDAGARLRRGGEHREGRETRRDGSRARSESAAFVVDVPEHELDLLLARPGAREVTLSALPWRDGEGFVEYGPSAGALVERTTLRRVTAGEPVELVLEGLRPDTTYEYRWCWREPDDEPRASERQGFHTRRALGSAFTFTITADSHLDAKTDPAVYLRTLRNARADAPDFHVDLGDTFMVDQRTDFREARPQYLAQRWYLGQLCASAPLFLALGNHDGELGYDERLAAWSQAQRTSLFPGPVSGGIHGGKATPDPDAGVLPSYYSWTWGDALFVVLDPYRFTTERVRDESEGWNRTLGREQYDWLRRTLEASRERYVFVFVHQLVGGLGKEGRGGIAAAPYFEWGGLDRDGSAGFAQHRPGWPEPLHDLFARHRVSAVFHGHDHLYAREELDGVTYQCVPQPGDPHGNTRSAEEYGYTSGTRLGSPGHLRLRVQPDWASVQYVRSAGRGRGGTVELGAEVADGYTIAPRSSDRR